MASAKSLFDARDNFNNALEELSSFCEDDLHLSEDAIMDDPKYYNPHLRKLRAAADKINKIHEDLKTFWEENP